MALPCKLLVKSVSNSPNSRITYMSKKHPYLSRANKADFFNNVFTCFELKHSQKDAHIPTTGPNTHMKVHAYWRIPSCHSHAPCQYVPHRQLIRNGKNLPTHYLDARLLHVKPYTDMPPTPKKNNTQYHKRHQTKLLMFPGSLDPLISRRFHPLTL